MRITRVLALGFFLSLAAAGSALSAQAPAGTTGVCGDGSYTSAKSKSGACSNHGGVKTWTGPAVTAPAPTAKPMTAPPKPMNAPAPTMAAKPANATGVCGDNSFTTAKSKSGACSNHGGVKDWYAAAAMSAPAPTMTKPAPVATQTAKPAPTAPAPTIKTAPVAGAPAGASALCNDGTYSMSAHRSGSCSNHKGVKQWLKDIPAN